MGALIEGERRLRRERDALVVAKNSARHFADDCARCADYHRARGLFSAMSLCPRCRLVSRCPENHLKRGTKRVTQELLTSGQVPVSPFSDVATSLLFQGSCWSVLQRTCRSFCSIACEFNPVKCANFPNGLRQSLHKEAKAEMHSCF